VSIWKVSLAALVLFFTGFCAGVLFPRPMPGAALPAPRIAPPATTVTAPAITPDGRRYDVVRKMTHELGLSEEQKQRIEFHIRESQDRTRVIWELVGPEVQEEFRKLRTDVGQELTPEQRKQFEAKLRKVRKADRAKVEEVKDTPAAAEAPDRKPKP
jgi:uncharacterized membrane protein